jgi:hypothetical protein
MITLEVRPDDGKPETWLVGGPAALEKSLGSREVFQSIFDVRQRMNGVGDTGQGSAPRLAGETRRSQRNRKANRGVSTV